MWVGGEGVQHADGSLTASLPSLGYYSQGATLIMLESPTQALVCLWLATSKHGTSSLLISWWHPGKPRWTQPAVLWIEVQEGVPPFLYTGRGCNNKINNYASIRVYLVAVVVRVLRLSTPLLYTIGSSDVGCNIK
jgi:hypothetical protein